MFSWKVSIHLKGKIFACNASLHLNFKLLHESIIHLKILKSLVPKLECLVLQRLPGGRCEALIWSLLPHASFPRALYFALVFLPTLIFLFPSLKPILGLGLPQNNLGTLAPAKDREHGHKSCKVTASWQAFCCRKTVLHCASSLTNIWIGCSFSRANSRLLGLRHYCQI